MESVKVGLVGAGHLSQRSHIPNLMRLRGAELVALAETRRELGRRTCQKCSIPKLYSDHMELLEDAEIEAVVAVLPIDLTPHVAEEVLGAGKHCFTEKPMAISSSQARRLAALAAEKNLVYMIGFNRRYDSGVNAAKEIIEQWQRDGTHGEICLVKAEYFGGDWQWNMPALVETEEPAPAAELSGEYPTWMDEALRNRFKSFLNSYTHCVNLVRYLTGPPEPEVHQVSFQEQSFIVVFRWQDAHITLSGGFFQSSPEWQERVGVYFKRGTVSVDIPPPLAFNLPGRVTVSDYAGGPETREVHAERSWSFYNELEHFLRCIREGKEPLSSGCDSALEMPLYEEIFRQGFAS